MTTPPVHVITPTPPEYVTGWVKQDPVTLAVAVRTTIEDDIRPHSKDWGVMRVDRGGMYATWDDVSAWPDLTTDAAADEA